MYAILVETMIQILPQAKYTYVKAIYELNPCTMHVVVLILFLQLKLQTILT